MDPVPAIPLRLRTSPSRTCPGALERVRELGGSIIHPGDQWAVCRDSEGSPFALAAAGAC